MEEEVKKELAELIDELVAKAGPTTGQIKTNQDPDKVARLLELGWKPAEKKSNEGRVFRTYGSSELDFSERLKKIEDAQKQILKTLAEHGEEIHQCSIQR